MKKPDLAKTELWRGRLEEFARGTERIVDFSQKARRGAVGVPMSSAHHAVTLTHH